MDFAVGEIVGDDVKCSRSVVGVANFQYQVGVGVCQSLRWCFYTDKLRGAKIENIA